MFAITLAHLIAVPLTGQTLGVSGDPSTMTIDSATPGFPPDTRTNSETTYAVSVDGEANVLVRLEQSLPSGVTLEIKLEAPVGAVSQGYVQLTTVDREAVTSILLGSYDDLAITYRLSSEAGAGTIPLSSRDVILTAVHK